jgi:hypothetical protein
MNKPLLKNRILLWLCPLFCWACPAKQSVEPVAALKMTAQLGKYIVYVRNEDKMDVQNATLELKAPTNELHLDTFQYVINVLALRAGARDSFYYEDFIDKKRGGYHYPLSVINKPIYLNVKAMLGTEMLSTQIKL